MSRSWSAALAVVLLLLAGCRTYGDYGSETEIYTQIERVLARFEEDLSRARADVQALEAAAEGNPYLAVLAAQYARIVEAHEALLDEQVDMAEELSPESTYRSLHRTYGAIVSEQQLVRQQYQGVLRYVYDAYSADTTVAANRDLPYYVVPPYYDRVTSQAAALTVSEVVARVTSGAAPRAGFRLLMPEATVADAPHGDDATGGHGGGDH